MPTVGHLALGLAAARLQPGSRKGLAPRLALYAFLGVAPDLDLVPVALGWGHLAFELALFAPLAAYALWPRSPRGAAQLRLIAALPLRAGRRFLPELRATGPREIRRVHVLATAGDDVRRTGGARPGA